METVMNWSNRSRTFRLSGGPPHRPPGHVAVHSAAAVSMMNSGAVKSRIQIVVSHKPTSREPGGAPGRTPLARLKLLLGGLLLAAVAIGILIAALILGSIFAAALWVALVVVVVGVILKAALRRARN